jgi:hypothetical protein
MVKIQVLELKEVRTLPDEYIEKMAHFYTSDFVAKNCPHIREIDFIDWLKVKAREKGWILT